MEAFAKGLVEPRLHLRLGLTQCGLKKNTWQAIWVFGKGLDQAGLGSIEVGQGWGQKEL